MLAVDTNLVVRYLAVDDPVQSARARAIIDAGDVFVPITVMLESSWVLRRTYRLSREAVAKALMGFAGLRHVKLDRAEHVSRAIDWAMTGLEFADALHLAEAENCNEFATFDRDFVKRAAAIGYPTVREP